MFNPEALGEKEPLPELNQSTDVAIVVDAFNDVTALLAHTVLSVPISKVGAGVKVIRTVSVVDTQFPFPVVVMNN